MPIVEAGNQLDKTELSRRAEIVAQHYGGILSHAEIFYIRSIQYAAGRSRAAFAQFEHNIAHGSDDSEAIALIHEALGHAAALSRFFWPSWTKGVAPARSAKLCTAFGLDASSPLRNRRLRDALEHFDERLDAFLLVNDTGHFYPDPVVASARAIDEAGMQIFKLVDPATKTFILLNERFPFEPLISEVVRVHEASTAFAGATRLPRPK